MKTLFAIRYKKDHSIYLGFKFHKRANDYFPTKLIEDSIMVADNELISDEVFTSTGEFFNDTWNEHTLLDELDTQFNLEIVNDNMYGTPSYDDNKSLIGNSIFVKDDWEVVKLSLNATPI